MTLWRNLDMSERIGAVSLLDRLKIRPLSVLSAGILFWNHYQNVDYYVEKSLVDKR